uniref:START domain-containing protein 10 n=1 Tax=Cacopsylla melanoneura TaxID=428564 RepID=A0A8D8X090_9HEMI
MQVGVVKIAEDEDFANLKKLVDDHDGWDLEYNKNDMQLYTRRLETEATNGKTDNSFKQLKVTAIFPDVEADIVYDVLHDPEYRKVWDTHMIDSVDIGNLNPNNDVGYYAMSCPTPMVNRDFVIQRSWLDLGKEKLILNHSVNHVDYPPRKGFVRATSYLTGFIVRTHNLGSWLGYVSWCDPQGNLPPWLVNKVTNIFGPKMIKNLLKASRNYFEWKCNNNPHFKPWIYPEQLQSPRISVQQCSPAPLPNTTEDVTPRKERRSSKVTSNHTTSTPGISASTYSNNKTLSQQDLPNSTYRTPSPAGSLTNHSSPSPNRPDLTPAPPTQSQSCPASPALTEKVPKKSKKLGFKMSFKKKK